MNHRSIYYISVLALCVVSYGVADASPRKKVKIGVESEPTPVETVESLRVAVGNQNVRGEWIIIKASGKEIDTLDERAYLFFSRHDNKLYSYTGCNYINSDYKAEGGKIAFSNIIISQRRCDAIRDEASILNALNRAASYEIYKDNRLDLEILDVKDKSGKVVLHTKRHKADVLSGVWSVTSIHGERTTPTSADEIRRRLKFKTVRLAAIERAMDLSHLTYDQMDFIAERKAQGASFKYITYKGWLFGKGWQYFDESTNKVVWPERLTPVIGG